MKHGTKLLLELLQGEAKFPISLRCLLSRHGGSCSLSRYLPHSVTLLRALALHLSVE
jgi:hypothetical protein